MEIASGLSMTVFATAITCPRPDLSDGVSGCTNTRLGEKLGHRDVSQRHMKTNPRGAPVFVFFGFRFVLPLMQECRRYLIVVQRVFLDEGLDEFFRSDVTDSLLRKEAGKGNSTGAAGFRIPISHLCYICPFPHSRSIK